MSTWLFTWCNTYLQHVNIIANFRVKVNREFWKYKNMPLLLRQQFIAGIVDPGYSELRVKKNLVAREGASRG
jgi:hypothetical protein